MMSNTYLPHVGGVARSVDTFTQEFRRKSNEVLVVAPQFPDTPEQEDGVIRIPAIQNFNGSDFSVRLPVPGLLRQALAGFDMDIVHAHHPFLLGDTALRIASERSVPLVFTHHTLYEEYTHYVPFDSPVLKRFAIQLSTRFANLCEGVIAPSESIKNLIRSRGVTTPIEVVPTGVDLESFSKGDGIRFRRENGIPERAFVVGHLGRLAREKNLEYLAQAMIAFMRRNQQAHFLLVGAGPFSDQVAALFAEAGLTDKLHLTGKKKGPEVIDAYQAMDVFAFSSKSETQGMVVAEAMAAGKPVVALDASGVREVVKDEQNGRLLPSDAPPETFAAAIEQLATNETIHESLGPGIRKTARNYSIEVTAERTLAFYDRIVADYTALHGDRHENEPWSQLLRLIETEWKLFTQHTEAAAEAFSHKSEADETPAKEKG